MSLNAVSMSLQAPMQHIRSIQDQWVKEENAL